MGNSSAKKEADEDHTDHERLGPARLELVNNPALRETQEEEEEVYSLHLTRSVESEKIYNEWVRSMEQIQDTETREILLLPDKHSFESVGLCGSGGVAKVTFDYYEFVLKTEIVNRSNLKKDFLETEIWYLLYNIVRAGHKFEHLRRKIGNVTPNNILINESGQIKVISTCSLPGELNNYEAMLEAQNDREVVAYLAPEEINLDLIQKGTYPSHVDPCLAEVFSIGLTILSSGTLESCDSVYSRHPYQIDKGRLNTLLRIFREKYSDFLSQTVAGMLALNPQERKKSSDIYKVLSEYENQILDLQPFQVQSYRPPPARQSNPTPLYQQPTNIRQPLEAPVFSQPPYYNSQLPAQNLPKYYGVSQGQVGAGQGGYYGGYYGGGSVPVYQRGV